MIAFLFAARGKQRLAWLALYLGALASLVAFLGTGPGALYFSASRMAAVQEAQGFARVGTFGNPQWPALVVGQRSSDFTLRLTAPNGQEHVYDRFPGALKVIHLRSHPGPGGAFSLVYRHLKPLHEKGHKGTFPSDR